jgi:GTPase SAR1 family protein
MDNFKNYRDELLGINEDTLGLFSTANSIPGISDHQFEGWEKTCAGLHGQLLEEVIRVAVVGPIKSGKSTFLNSILRGDYLKRGAGVVTSIVTRIRAGSRLKAQIYFKSWDEVNADMEQALVLFPASDRRFDDGGFDIRAESARAELKNALKSLKTEQLINRDTRSINNVLLSSYLKGYPAVSEILDEGAAVRQYEGIHFAEHKAFVGNESLAVYLKDVQIEVDSPGLEANLELADCQGSDSSNPLHLAMIQDYLLLTHLIIYVISSRTGLRGADIRFLSMIKKMGIIDNILFVVNCDFSEHEDLEELKALIRKIREELAMIKPEPQLYAFSALFNLFSVQKHHLSTKNDARLKQWETEKDLVDFSSQEKGRFESAFRENLTRKRNSLLLKNHLERLDVMIAGTENWIGLNQDVLNRDAKSAQDVIQKLQHHQERLGQLKSALNTTLAGSVAKLNHKLSQDVNRFFDVHSGAMITEIFKFIKEYKELPQFSGKKIDLSAFTGTIYLAYQNFKQSLDVFIAETINPEVIRFIKMKEKEIAEQIETVIQPYAAMLHDAYAEYGRLIDKLGITANFEDTPRVETPDMEALFRQSGLKPPAIVASMRYSAGVKTAGVVRFGFYNLQRNFNKLIKRPVKERSEVVRKALNGSAQQMKRETLKSVAAHLRDFRENLKFGYFHKLVEATTQKLAEILLDRFQIYALDLSTISRQIANTKVDKEKASEILQKMEQSAQGIKGKIERLRKNIE